MKKEIRLHDDDIFPKGQQPTIKEIIFKATISNTDIKVEGYYFKTPLTSGVDNAGEKDGLFFMSGSPRHCIADKTGCVHEIDHNTLEVKVEKEKYSLGGYRWTKVKQ